MDERYTYKDLGVNRCSITDNEQEIEYLKEVIYWAPSEGGYVHNVTFNPGVTGKQITWSGNNPSYTVYWDGKGRLIDLIKRWWKS